MSHVPNPPLLTPPVARRLLGRSQVQIAAEAGVGIGTVRIYELDPYAVHDANKRRALDAIYSRMRIELATPPSAA